MDRWSEERTAKEARVAGVRLRKRVFEVVETHRENGQVVPGLHRVAIVGAVIENPFPEGFVEDLVTTADEIAQEIGLLVGPQVVDLLDGRVEAFGKAALVGLGGELEQGSALIHNLRFGNVFRDAAKGSELLPAAEKVGPTGAPIDIPLKHKNDAKTRSHHQTVTFCIADAPLHGEIVIICAGANAGRPLARLATFAAEVR
jgi:hypothetical protein